MKRVYSIEGCSPTIHTMQGGNTFPKIMYKYAIKKIFYNIQNKYDDIIDLDKNK